jgi:hypothetical protein
MSDYPTSVERNPLTPLLQRIATIKRIVKQECIDDLNHELAREYREIMRAIWNTQLCWSLERQDNRDRFRVRGTAVERVSIRLLGH